MAVPKKKHTKTRRNKRRANKALKKIKLAFCPKCKEPILPHHFCPFCGTYKGKEVIDVMAKLSKKERKKKEKEIAKQEEEKTAKEPKKPLSLEELSKK